MRTKPQLMFVLLSAGVLLWGGEGRAFWEGRSGEGSQAQQSGTTAVPFQLELKRDATFSVLYHQVPLLGMEFKFWEANWKWANPLAESGELRNGSAPFNIRITGLAADVSGTISTQSPDQLIYEFVVRHSATRPGTIGGGCEFALDLKTPLFDGRVAPDPQLSPGGEGWFWPIGAGRDMRVAFSPAAKKVYFENDNKARIRAFFVGESSSAGLTRYRMTVTLPRGTMRKASLAEEYGPVDAPHWLPNAFPYPNAPVDMSAMNHVPGKHGFLKVAGDHLEFEDGTRARFWGINVMAYALFSSDEQIAKHARRLAMLGFNLVRLHHHDSTAWVSPTVIDKHSPDSRTLDERGINRIDYWIKCLKENGIYVWLDLHSYRQFRDGDRSTELGTVATFDEFARSKQQSREVKGFCQYDPVLQKLMEEFQRKYLSHVNHYTGLAYKDDPAVAFVLVTNENDITHHYGMRAIPRAGHVELNRLFNERVAAFARKTGLPEREMREPWRLGPAKIFLNDQEHAFYSEMLRGIRATGFRGPVAVGNMWGDNPLSSIPALTAGDIIDVHAYDGPGTLTADPRYRHNIADSIGLRRVSGKPLTVSEWNLESYQEPSVDRFAAPLFVASIAALQGWDALMLYGYSQQVLSNQIPNSSVWDSYNDPALLAVMPAAALLFRKGHVSAAKKEYCLALSPEQMFGPRIVPESCAAARTLIEQSRFAVGVPATPALDWLVPAGPRDTDVVIRDPDKSFLPADAHRVTSDTGELSRDWEAGIQTIDTPKTQAVQGAIGGRAIRLSDVGVLVETRHAAVAVSTMDNQPLRSSTQILITTVARALKPKRGAWKADRTVYSEPVRGEITVRAPAGLEAVRLSPTGGTLALSGIIYENGEYRIPLRNNLSHWYLLRKPEHP